MRLIRSEALLCVALAGLLVGCGDESTNPSNLTGSGTFVTITDSSSAFTSLSASQAFQLTVTRAQKYSIAITVDDNIEEYVVARKDGDTFALALSSFRSYNRVTARAAITMPELQSVLLSGASSAVGSGFTTTGTLSLRVSGASTVALSSGGGQRVAIDASGASLVDLSEFPVDDADVNLSGASRSTVQVRNRIDATVSGASVLTYSGSPEWGRRQVSGASQILEAP